MSLGPSRDGSPAAPTRNREAPGGTWGNACASAGLSLALGAGPGLLNQLMKIPEEKHWFPGMASLET